MESVVTVLFWCLGVILGLTILMFIIASIDSKKKSFKSKVLKNKNLKKKYNDEFESIYNQLVNGKVMNEVKKEQRKNFIKTFAFYAFTLLSPFLLAGIIIFKVEFEL